MAKKPNLLDDRKIEVLNFFVDQYMKGNETYFQVGEVYKGLEKKIPQIPLRFVLIWLLENGFLESMKTGKLSQYYRVFRIKLKPESPGCAYYVSRQNNKSFGEA